MTISTIWDNVRLRRGLCTIGVTVFWLIVWQTAAWLMNDTMLLPSPLTVLAVLKELAVTPLFWRSVGYSLIRICLGFVLGVTVGTVLAIITARWLWLRRLCLPLLHVIRAAPVASFIIMTVVWFSYEQIPIFISSLMVLPIVWLNVEQGIREVDPLLKETTRVYQFSLWKTCRLLYIPAVRPYFLTAAVNGLGFAWKSGIAAEVICQPQIAVGKQLYRAKVLLESPEIFAWTVVVVLLSLLLERLLIAVTDRQKKGDVTRDTF